MAGQWGCTGQAYIRQIGQKTYLMMLGQLSCCLRQYLARYTTPFGNSVICRVSVKTAGSKTLDPAAHCSIKGYVFQIFASFSNLFLQVSKSKLFVQKAIKIVLMLYLVGTSTSNKLKIIIYPLVGCTMYKSYFQARVSQKFKKLVATWSFLTSFERNLLFILYKSDLDKSVEKELPQACSHDCRICLLSNLCL